MKCIGCCTHATGDQTCDRACACQIGWRTLAHRAHNRSKRHDCQEGNREKTLPPSLRRTKGRLAFRGFTPSQCRWLRLWRQACSSSTCFVSDAQMHLSVGLLLPRQCQVLTPRPLLLPIPLRCKGLHRKEAESRPLLRWRVLRTAPSSLKLRPARLARLPHPKQRGCGRARCKSPQFFPRRRTSTHFG